jgi:cold shock CspA family protein
LINDPKSTGDPIEYHLRRSFTPGDSSHLAQLYYGRQLFLNGKLSESEGIFERLGNARVKWEDRNRIIGVAEANYHGSVSKKEISHGFVIRDGLGDWIFVHRNNIDEPVWKALSIGTRVLFQIGFNFKGPSIVDLKMENAS